MNWSPAKKEILQKTVKMRSPLRESVSRRGTGRLGVLRGGKDVMAVRDLPGHGLACRRMDRQQITGVGGLVAGDGPNAESQ